MPASLLQERLFIEGSESWGRQETVGTFGKGAGEDRQLLVMNDLSFLGVVQFAWCQV